MASEMFGKLFGDDANTPDNTSAANKEMWEMLAILLAWQTGAVPTAVVTRVLSIPESAIEQMIHSVGVVAQGLCAGTLVKQLMRGDGATHEIDISDETLARISRAVVAAADPAQSPDTAYVRREPNGE